MENKDSNQKKILEDLSFEADLKIGPFKILNKIGHGHFGSVFYGIDEETNEKVAIKRIKKSKLNNEDLLTSEINIQKILFHPNLCRIYCVIEHEDYLFLINEFCPGGDILQNIADQDSAFSEEISCKIFQQIISGLEYLHKNFICHRDIKPENILLTEANENNITVKITDFGLSKSFEGEKLLKTPCGSPLYAAPEILSRKEYKGDKIDIWSSGIVLYTMVYGNLPFNDENMKDLVYNITKGNYDLPDTISKECQDLIKKILQIDPNKRISIQEIKEHPWMNKFKFNLMKSPGLFINEDILPIDIQIIKEMGGNNKSKIHELIDDIIKNKLNLNTVSYYLNVNKKIKNGDKSISDISSDSELFLNYTKNEISKIKYWNGNLDSRIKNLEEEIINSFSEDKSIDSKKTKLTSVNLELDNSKDLKNDENIGNNTYKQIDNKKEDIKNNDKKIKNKKIKKSHSQKVIKNDNEKEDFHPISKNDIYINNNRHIKNDKNIKDINKEENKKENELIKNLIYQKIPIILFAHNIINDIINKATEKVYQKQTDLYFSNVKKIYIKQFHKKINNDQNMDINKDKKLNKNIFFDFMSNHLKFSINNTNLTDINKNNNIKNMDNKNKLKKNKSMNYLLDNEESKEQIIQRKKIVKIKLSSNDKLINNEKKKKIIYNNYTKGEEDLNVNKNNYNNILNFISMKNIIPKNKIHTIDLNDKEYVPFKRHQKIKILLNEIKDLEIKQENKNNIKEEHINNKVKNNNNNNDDGNYSFITDSSISKIEIVLKSLLKEFTILNKTENEINYNCQKMDEKGEKINFSLIILKEKDINNFLTFKLINGNKNSFEELFFMVKNIFNFT